MPVMEFDHPEKGDALYAMELALALEKLTNEKLLQLHQVAADANDPQMTDFIEGEFLTEQVEAINKVSEFVAQLRRVGKGHGVSYTTLTWSFRKHRSLLLLLLLKDYSNSSLLLGYMSASVLCSEIDCASTFSHCLQCSIME